MRKISSFLDESSSGLHDRTRLTAIYIACLGALTVVVTTLALISMNLSSTVLLYESLVDLIILTLIAVSAIRNFKTAEVLNIGLVSLLVTYWISKFSALVIGEAELIMLGLSLFLPLFLVVALNYKLSLTLVPFQAVSVFVFYTQFGIFVENRESYRFDISASFDSPLFGLALVCAALSALSIITYAAVGFVRQKKDIQLIKLIEENKIIASTDDLTRLMNRRAFNEKVREVWNEEIPFTLAYLDLDRFKPINDQFGHAAGDEVLKKIAEQFSEASSIRYAARLGGDEFAFILEPDIDANKAQIVIPQIYSALKSDIKTEYGVIRIGGAIGYAVGRVDIQQEAKIIVAAEHAMRRAKTNGFGWARFSEMKDTLEFSGPALERKIKHAIHHRHIRAALQPIISAKTQNIEGYELLARWVDSQFSRNPTPNEFIPVVEKMGLLDDLLWLTLEEVFQNTKLDSKYLAINISPSQILGEDFLKNLVACLDKYAVPPENIILEITEQVAYRNLQENIKVLQMARDLGIQVAMDDFGAGYSSLSVLGTLPLTKIKIDQSLIRDLRGNERKQSILRTAINMSHQLGLTCCVEGVETQDMSSYLSTLDVDELQGYWIGYPELVMGESDTEKVA